MVGCPLLDGRAQPAHTSPSPRPPVSRALVLTPPKPCACEGAFCRGLEHLETRFHVKKKPARKDQRNLFSFVQFCSSLSTIRYF